MIELTKIGAQLIFIGIAFFTVGLIQGAFIPKVKNSRMALSGHLTAVQCAMALAIFGVIWSQVVLPLLLAQFVAYGTALGFVLIWLGITLASLTGASTALPIAGAGFSASDSIEKAVMILVRLGSILSLITCTVLVVGLIPILGLF
ncbi:hydrogenase [Catenovulum sp. SM1970]|uniref:hydrogenase n=1 Tax=Marinifaba aquimaris TaxID=2741323 RepID=UPI001572DD05|nr:hydrogenase [Marinifaba aquimaris]NTS78476.1 hydrogenase [Marinifaba aquimaris]